MTRHLQQPYRIWPLDDLDTGNANEKTLKHSTHNHISSLSAAKCDNPLAKPIRINEMASLEADTVPEKPTPTPAKAIKNFETASQQVLTTTELIENILSHLPPVTLYNLRKVNKYWASLIQTSPTLRQNLWLTPSGPAITPSHSKSLKRQFTINPVLYSLRIFSTDRGGQGYPYLHFVCRLRFPPRWRTKDAFWRDMQITDPPVKSIFLRSSWLDKYAENEGGVTAGQLSDMLEFQTGALYWFHS
ncbi:hypothetical protein EJ08DRAFT_677124 [Tothia fuscella]|uniref:F-box domain-containing protein n=1 Tax=Tothia fuscella TaxID=1048955 RepID=A0A9P4NW94_9PEZI|nr:hypothetical protein EJ08DRAFT_677124 [Tothia fuscella]